MMHSRLALALGEACLHQGADDIYSAPLPAISAEQSAERVLRENVAVAQHADYLAEISRNHSIPVMDHEVDRFLANMPRGALIVDVGGCWGWHWRRLAVSRPDVGIVIVDFVRANLLHARQVLGALVGSQVALVHADATSLPFPTGLNHGFDGVWTVQVFQHIPSFARACAEAHRVLNPGGRFANYSLHATPVNRALYRMIGRHFHTDGMVKNLFHLTRANDHQRDVVTSIFGGVVTERYTECLFHPDLRVVFSGRENSRLGRLDAKLGDVAWVGRWIARQRSTEAMK